MVAQTPIQKLYSNSRTFLQDVLGVCERVFQESGFDPALFSITSIEGLVERYERSLRFHRRAKILTGPFTIHVENVDRNQFYRVHLEVPGCVLQGTTVFDELERLRDKAYREFEIQGIPYSRFE